MNCVRLEKIVIAGGVTEIGDYAFFRCGSLTEAVFPDTLKKIGDYAFKHSNLSYFNENGLPKGVEYIGKEAFSSDSLTVLLLPASLVTVSDRAFYECGGLVEVTVPGNVKTLGESAFAGCRSLVSVKIEEGVETLGDRLFSGCGVLERVDIPSTVTKIGDELFVDCDLISAVNVDRNNNNYCVSGNCLIEEKSGRLLLAYGEAVIPADKNIKIIESRAFEHCASQKAALPGSVEEISDFAFFRTSLIEISIPGNVAEIGEYAFADSYDLAVIFIPRSVKKIGRGAFNNCLLKDIYYGGSEEEWLEKIDPWVRNEISSKVEMHFLNIQNEKTE